MNKIFTPKTIYLLAGLIAVNLFVLTDADFLEIGTAFSFMYIMIVPGVLVLPFLTRKRMPWMLGLALSVSLSALILTLLGLIVNTLLPYAGMMRPLDTIPALMAFDVLVSFLLAMMTVANKESAIAKPDLAVTDKAIVLMASLLPIMAMAGAVVLSNGGNNAIAMAVIVLIAVLSMIVTLTRARISSSSYAVLLYGVTVSILLMTSMRGYYLTGHDVQLEYQVFSMTNRLKFWDMDNFQDAYNACLSITILPTYLQSLLGVKDFYIYKLFFQFISGFLSVIIFYLSRNFTTKKTAFLAGLLYITFPTFMVDMAMLNRQGMALLFFGALMLVLLTDEYFTGKKRSILLVMFGTGMILSHYSTSYIAVAILAGGYAIDSLLRIFFSLKRPGFISKSFLFRNNLPRLDQPRLLQLPVTISLIAVLAIWTGPVTETSQNLVHTMKNIATSLQNPFAGDSNAGPKKYSLTNAVQLSKDELFEIYVAEEIAKSRADASEEEFYPDSITQQYKETPIDEPILPLKPVGARLQETLDTTLKSFYNETKQFYAKIMQIFIFISLFALFLGYGFMRHLRRDVPLEYLSLSAAGIFIMAMQIVLPQSVIDYGLLRLFQQNLVLLALPITLGFLSGFGLIVRKARSRLVLFASFLVSFFLILSGFIPQVTGGSRPMLTLNNSGFYYDAYYIHGGEMDAMLWLKGLSIDMPVQSDRYFSNVRLLAYSDIGAHTKLLPEVTLKEAMVYLSHVNAEDESVIEFIDGDVLYYRQTSDFFDDNKNLIYDSGDSKIYK